MINFTNKKYFRLAIIVLIIVIVISVILSIIFRYEVEGENKETLPFLIEKISIVSTADGLKNEPNTEYLWSGEILQINDVYIKISQNEALKGVLKSIKIEDIKILTTPLKGNINIARIAKNEDTSNKYIIENLERIEFNADKETSLENFTVANQGGIIGLRLINKGLGIYNSNESEIHYDGRILNIENIKNEEIKFKMSFDIIIEVVEGIDYRTFVKLELPAGNIIEKGIEITDFENIDNLVYKRY